MKTALTLFAMIIAARMPAAVPDHWLDLIAVVESQRDPSALGDRDWAGVARARGEFQFWRVAWNDTTRLRIAQGLPTWPYSAAHSRQEARAYAQTWFNHIETRLWQATGRRPGIGELWAASNLGFSGFKDREFDLSNCPSLTRRKAAWLVAQTEK